MEGEFRCRNRFALLTAMEYTSLLLHLSEDARQKILEKTHRLQREMASELTLVRPP